MNTIKPNPLSLRTRCKELTIDYLVIVAYLVGLLVVALLFYTLVFRGVPQIAMWQSQLIALFASVVPIIAIFTVFDWRGGSPGKRKSGLTVRYKTHHAWRSAVRNIVKFLPWQLAHVGVIGSVYADWQSPVMITFIYASLAFALLLLSMTISRKDKRHLGDMIAGTQVVGRVGERRQVP